MRDGAVPRDATLLRSLIRDVHDFPKPGIAFKDITPLLGNADAFAAVTDDMAQPWLLDRVTHVVAIESRGFILGGPIAQRLGVGLIPVRKPGKLPGACLREAYGLEYGSDALEIHVDALPVGSRVIVVDDVLATGGTAAAACRLVDALGSAAVGCAFLIELDALDGRSHLTGRRVEALLHY